MKKSKKCPKCGSKKIGYFGFVPDYDNKLHSQAAIIGYTKKSAFKKIKHKIEAYVCTSCGVLEYYVQDTSDITFDKIAGFQWAK